MVTKNNIELFQSSLEWTPPFPLKADNLKKYNTKIPKNDSIKELNTLNLEINQINKDVKSLNTKIENYDNKIEGERNNIIGSLSLFVAFFTFISINITIFSKIDDLFTALILMLGMVICISMMLLIFFGLLNSKKEENEIKIIEKQSIKDILLLKIKNIFCNTYFSIFFLLLLIMFIFLIMFYFYNLKLTPNIEKSIKEIQDNNKISKDDFQEKINSLENENKLLKESLDQKISKEIELQLLKKSKNNNSGGTSFISL